MAGKSRYSLAMLTVAGEKYSTGQSEIRPRPAGRLTAIIPGSPAPERHGRASPRGACRALARLRGVGGSRLHRVPVAGPATGRNRTALLAFVRCPAPPECLPPLLSPSTEQFFETHFLSLKSRPSV